MKKLPHGTIFAVPLPDGTFVCGRVLLDIYGTLKRHLFPHDSPLPGLGKAHLVEMYSATQPTPEFVPSPLLIAGAFVESKDIGSKWPVVGQHPVNPRAVEFPESLITFRHPLGDAAFECGEISIPLPLANEDVQRIGVLRTRHSAFLWPYTCLRVMGRRTEVPADYKMATLEGGDLRISPNRAEVYKHLPFSMDQSYYEKQARLGLDFDRLFV